MIRLTYLLEKTVEVYMDDVCVVDIEQDVLQMPVTQSEIV